MVRVKVCGITNYEDAALAVDLGVNALGFNFYPKSSRYISTQAARAIIRRLPAFVTSVGVFVNEPDPDQLIRKAERAGVTCIQLHGTEKPQFCRKLARFPLIKAFRVTSDFDLDLLSRYPVNTFLLDTFVSEQEYGGTGRRFDWQLAVRAKRYGRLILAGGLNPENIAQAIRFVRPYGVDVCSGVERRPGRKDPRLLRAFVDEVESARAKL